MALINTGISIKNLSFAYGKHIILNQVSVDIPEKNLTLLLGKNGSGKSTFLRLIAGLLPIQSGLILVDGRDMRKLNAKQRAKLVGFLPQKHQAIFPFRVIDVVLTGRAAHVNRVPSRNDLAIAREAIEKTGLTHLENRIYSQLSGGEQQLVMIARALAQKPKILLFDEPISHLDFNNQVKLLQLLKQLVAEGITIAAVLHDPNMAIWAGDHFLLAENHGFTAYTPDEIIKQNPFEKIFNIKTHQVNHLNKVFFIPEV